MKSLLILLFSALWVIFLTLATQAGGLAWIVNRMLFKRFFRGNKASWSFRTLSFAGFYLIVTFAIVPPIARAFGRTTLPVFVKNHIQPVTIWTCILNRHYVRLELKKSVEAVAARMNAQFPGTEIHYLDANLPFIDGFPLLPHLSHNDGRKLDLAFYYLDKRTAQPTNDQPSFSGYGVFEGPRPDEINTTATCLEKGNWQYDYNKYMAFGSNAKQFVFDETRTRTMIQAFIDEMAIEKMFVEPHLKSRLGFQNNSKVRFHGCQAVRHDDHLHIQIKRQ